MATQTSNGLVKSWVKRAERAAQVEERKDSLTAKAMDSRGMSFFMRSSTPTLLTDSHDEDDSPREYGGSRKGRGGKRGLDEGSCSDDEGVEEQKMRASSAFADKVQDYMQKHSVSQTQLGVQVGLRQQQISRWIFGKGTAATRQAVERRIRSWLKKRSVSLEENTDKKSRNQAGKGGAKAVGSGRKTSSKPSLIHGHAGKKRKRLDAEKMSDGMRASGRRARLADTPADAYANDFAYTLHKYIKQIGLSQEKLGKTTGLRQQQISSYMFRKCSETMHNLVEQTLRKWLIKEKLELPGFTTAQLKGKPMQWRPRPRKSATGTTDAGTESDSDVSDESDGSTSEDEAMPHKTGLVETKGGSQCPPQRYKSSRSFYCSEGSQSHRTGVGMSLSRRPVSKAQAMEYARLAAQQQQPIRLPFEGAFVIPPSCAHGGISGKPLAENGVSGVILRAQDGGVVDVKPGTNLFTPGGRMKVGYDDNGSVTLRLVAPLMQVASKAQQEAQVGDACTTVKPALSVPWMSATVKPTHPPSRPGDQQEQQEQQEEQEQEQEQEQRRQQQQIFATVKPAVPPPRTGGHQQRQQQVGPAEGAQSQAATSPSSEPDDEPSESKGSNHAAPAPAHCLRTVAATMTLDRTVAGATAALDVDRSAH